MALKLEGFVESEFGLASFRIFEEKHGSHTNLVVEEDGSIRDDVTYHEWLSEVGGPSAMFYKSEKAFSEGKGTSFKAFTAKVEKQFPSE